MRTKSKRKQYSLIDRRIQYKFLAIILVYSVIIVVFFAISMCVSDILDLKNEHLSVEMRAAAAKRIHSLHYRLWPGATALVCLIGIHSLRIFHRLFGPLYKFRWILSKISRGDLSCRVKLRKKDYLHQEEAMFNEMMDLLTEKWGSMRGAVLDARKSFGALERNVAKVSGWRDADQKLLQKHGQNLEVLDDRAQYFRLKEEETLEQSRIEPPA